MDIDKTKLYYFAHPYTSNIPIINILIHIFRYIQCLIRTARLLKRGFMVFSPIAHSAFIPVRLGWDAWMDLDHKIMQACDAMIIPKNYKNSLGCLMEYTWFKNHGKTVLFYEDIVRN